MPPVLTFANITKRFPGVIALDDVSFAVERGSAHALVGENGAGKSTLGKILAGIHAPDAGVITLDGKPLSLRDPRHALAHGIGMVHQELSFCANMTVAENLCLADLPRKSRWFISQHAMVDRARSMLDAIGVSLNVALLVEQLSTAQQQMVQIAQAVAVGAKVIIFDEPTSSLSHQEADQLFALIARLKQRGVTMLYVSHRMPEILEHCDAATILRDGKHIATRAVRDLTENALVELMIGRPLNQYFPKHMQNAPGDEALRVEGLSSPGKFSDISFTLRRGEVLGLAGLVGAGRSETAQAIFGLDANATGAIHVDGQPATIRRPADAIRLGIALLPESRKDHGIVAQMSCRDNLTLAVLCRDAIGPLINTRAEREVTEQYFERLHIKAASPHTPIAGLSGGNQQKVVLGKWLATKPRVLLLDEPTRGVDIGAKAQIHSLIDELARNGVAILLISSEMPELLALSSRIAVLREGRIAGTLARDEVTQSKLMAMMSGVAETHGA